MDFVPLKQWAERELSGYGTDDEVTRNAEGIETDKWSNVAVNLETFETSRPGVFAGGDCVNGADLVVTALADGRRAAETIHSFLAKQK